MADQSEALAGVVDGRAWEEFCDTLKAAGAVVLSGPDDPLDRAEGWRYLSRLLRAGLETFVEASDASAPRFQRTTNETVKMGMDSPDNVYLNAPMNGASDYRIWGTRGTVHYLGFGTQAGNYAATGSPNTTGYLEAKDMKLGPGGTFEIIASSKEQPAGVNWLPMQPETRMIQIRQTPGEGGEDDRGDSRARIRALRKEARVQIGVLKSKRRESARNLKKLSAAAGGTWEEIKQSADAILAEGRANAASLIDRIRKGLAS